MELSDGNIIQQTRQWLENVVIKTNFCPFAGKVVKDNTVRYRVVRDNSMERSLEIAIEECLYLDENENIETTLIIYPFSFEAFDDYLEFVAMSTELIIQQGYEGVYQLASFHPLYRFAASPPNDPANYTNRALYPMLHLLREESLEKALANYENPEYIPIRNVELARTEGLEKMKKLRLDCFKLD